MLLRLSSKVVDCCCITRCLFDSDWFSIYMHQRLTTQLISVSLLCLFSLVPPSAFDTIYDFGWLFGTECFIMYVLILFWILSSSYESILRVWPKTDTLIMKIIRESCS